MKYQNSIKSINQDMEEMLKENLDQQIKEIENVLDNNDEMLKQLETKIEKELVPKLQSLN